MFITLTPQKIIHLAIKAQDLSEDCEVSGIASDVDRRRIMKKEIEKEQHPAILLSDLLALVENHDTWASDSIEQYYFVGALVMNEYRINKS